MGGEYQGREGDMNTKPTTYSATMTGWVTLADLKPIPAEHTPGDMTRQTRSGAQYSGRQFPLMATPGGGMRYKPWAFQDTSNIAEAMPPTEEGGRKWMRKLAQLTQGMTLAVGDWRQLMGRQTTGWDLEQIECS